MKANSYRTGRTDRVRAWLADNPGRWTARELLDALEPGGSISLMTATLGTLAKGKHLVREGAGFRNVSFRLPDEPAPARARKCAAPRVKEVKRSFAGSAEVANARLAIRRGKAAPASEALNNIARAKPRSGKAVAQRTNFHAAPGTVYTIPPTHLSASVRIAADIAAFENRGGRIERLGITRLFHNAGDGDD